MAARAVRYHAHCHDVLVIDDYESTRDAIVTMLEVHGFRARGAASGPEALDMFQGGSRPCFVLLDVRMPGMDGWQTWERMQAHPEVAAIPVVVLSADVADHARAQHVGIREVLRKPIHGKHLLAAVEKHCERSRERPAS